MGGGVEIDLVFHRNPVLRDGWGGHIDFSIMIIRGDLLMNSFVRLELLDLLAPTPHMNFAGFSKYGSPQIAHNIS